MTNKFRLKPGSRVFSDDGRREFIVDTLIHEGSGQGDIYKVHAGRETYAMKLYHTGDPLMHRRQIGNLQKRGRASAAFVHPLFTVKVGERIGYVMEYVGGDHFTSASVLFNGIRKNDGNGNQVRMELPFHQKLEILYNIVEAIMILYEADIALMDVKFDNIMVNMNDLTVKILDTDTAVGRGSKPIVRGTVGFMEPRVMRGEILPSKYSDAYALAVMIWMTLISGHPLRGKKYDEPCNNDIDTYTFAINPIYVYHRKDASNRPPETDKRVIERMKVYPKYFADAMHRTFVDGLFDGSKRVEPREWLDILTQLYEDHFICKQCGEEQFFGTSAKNCHVCGAELSPPIKIFCEKSQAPGVRLFNGTEVWTGEVFGDQNSAPLFRVVPLEHENKYGLLCIGHQSVTVKLQNGLEKELFRNDVLPIFMDATITVGKHILKFLGGRVS